MAHNAPGKHYRKGISLMALMEMFPNDETAEGWFASVRWESGEPTCPFCGSLRAALIPNRKPMPYRCKDCRKHFSVKHGTVMQSSKLGCRVWAIAVYLLTTGIKGTSSMKLHRDVAVTYKTAWHLAHRIRKAFPGVMEQFAGPVEADETAIGGVEKNKHGSKKRRLGRGSVGKAIVHGVLDRATNQVVAGVVEGTDAATLQGRVVDATIATAQVYTDEATAYTGMPRHHETVRHFTGEYVREQAPHQRNRELLGDARPRHHGQLPPRQPQAPRPVYRGVRGSPQPAVAGHDAANAARRGRHGGEAAALQGVDCMIPMPTANATGTGRRDCVEATLPQVDCLWLVWWQVLAFGLSRPAPSYGCDALLRCLWRLGVGLAECRPLPGGNLQRH